MNNVDGKSSIQFHVTFLILKINFSSFSALDLHCVVYFHFKTSQTTEGGWTEMDGPM